MLARQLQTLMSERLANGAGLILLELDRIGCARASQLKKASPLQERVITEHLRKLLDQGYIRKRLIIGHQYYQLSPKGQAFLSRVHGE